MLALLLGLGLGVLIGWLLASRRMTRETLSEHLNPLTRELRDQLTRRDESLATLQAELSAEREKRTQAETRLEEASRSFAEQKKMLDESEKKLKESFDALSARALQNNAEQFLVQARKTLDAVLVEARGDLGKRQDAIKALIQPVSDTLKRYEEQIRHLEQSRQKAYGSLEEQVKLLTATNQQLQQETGKLVTSLRDPRVRGRWGEIALRRAAELAGMAEHVDFEQQTTYTDDEDGRYRPDMVVRLPGNRSVVIDAKAVLDAYLDAVAATDDDTRQAQLRRHASQIRSRIRELSSKRYWERLETTPEFVVLFLPAESFFSAAVGVDPDLIDNALASKVVLASPTTLVSLLKAIAYGWRQEQIEENARHISDLGRELYERMSILVDHLGKIGLNLERAVGAYNSAVGSFEGRVLPSARKFKELGATGGKDLDELEPVERHPRALESPEALAEQKPDQASDHLP